MATNRASKPRNRYCFLCGSIGKENYRSLFSVPKDKLEEWQKLLPKAGLCKNSKLCELHFDPEDISKEREIMDKIFSYRQSTLRPLAVPKNNLKGK